MPNISVREVMQKIKQDVLIKEGLNDTSSLNEDAYEKNRAFTARERKKNNKIYHFAKKIGKYLHKKGLYKFVAFVQKNLNLHQNNHIYALHDFIKFYDEEFIDNAYKLILNRPADHEGKNHFLPLLRTGDLSKTEIVISLHFSKEGRAQNIIILGIKKRYIISLIYKIPFIGYIAKLSVILMTLPKLVKRINQFENNTVVGLGNNEKNQLKLQELVLMKADDLEDYINTKTENLKEEINTKADIEEFELYLQAVNYAKEYMKISQRNMQNLIDEAKKRLPKRIFDQKALLTITQEEQHQYDAFYVEFEDRFRGSREDIKSRVEVYIPYLKNLPFEKEQINVLDVGCGRAEWLEVLSENKYKAEGIDLNQIMVSISQGLHFDVKKADVIEHLKSLKDESLSVITGFHIIEHLPFEVLMALFQESLRVLKKGGMIIFETPNPENILVGAHYFYTDPTHINPLIPATVQFMAEKNGFMKVEIKRLHKYSEYNDIDVDSQFIQDNFSNEMDYAVIGYKK